MRKDNYELDLLLLNQKKWDSRVETLDKKRFIYDLRRFQKAVVDLIDFGKVSSFLDIGCGTG